MKKKRILYWTDGADANTGNGQVALRLLKSWYKTGKYDILHLCGCTQDGNPNFQKFPWTCRGAIPNNPAVIQRMNQDPGFARAASYGSEMIEQMVLEFKPDIVLCQQDSWGSSDIASEKRFWNKTNCISWETYDSLPLYQKSLEIIGKLKNHYSWSTFAEKEFHRLGHKHVRTQFPPVNASICRPLSQSEKEQLKKYFKIEDKKFIVNYVFRSQLRKQSWSLIEAYSLLQKNHPEIAKDVWIHFHTSTKEGWDHKRFCLQYGVDYNRILYTWICKNCRELQIKSDNGDCNCPHCSSQNSQETCGVGFGATPEQMNWVYNVGDCSTILANSGATEMPAIEALAAGLPLATVNYSYGEDFCAQDFVFTIDSTKSIEFGTQFIKIMPVASSIQKFIKKIYNAKPAEIKEISEKGRKWVTENFDTEIVSKKWQDVFDNMPEVTWDFTYKEEIKDPNAPIENIEDDFEFICTAYERILKMMDMRDKNKPETAHWLNFLKQPKDKNQLRNELVNTFRQIAAQKNAEQQKTTLEDLLDKSDKERVLLVLKESLGDHLILTSLLPEIRNKYPEASIYIGGDPKYQEVYEMNEYVKKYIPYHDSMEQELLMVGVSNHKGPFNFYVNVATSTQKQLNYLSNLY